MCNTQHVKHFEATLNADVNKCIFKMNIKSSSSLLLVQSNEPVFEAPEANFMKLVQGLIEDTDGREHFLKVAMAQTYFSCMSLFHFLHCIIVTYFQSVPVFL